MHKASDPKIAGSSAATFARIMFEIVFKQYFLKTAVVSWWENKLFLAKGVPQLN